MLYMYYVHINMYILNKKDNNDPPPVTHEDYSFSPLCSHLSKNFLSKLDNDADEKVFGWWLCEVE